VAAGSLAAVGGTRGKTGVALAANLLVAVVLGGEHLQRRFDDTTAQTENQVKSRLLLNVVVTQSATILQLFSGENETLLIRRNTFLVLDFRLDIVDGVRGLHLKGDRLAREGLDENLHDS